MCASRPSFVALLLAAIFAVSPAFAADKKDKADPNKEQIRRMQQVQRKLEQEKAAVVSELEEEKKKVESEALRSTELKRDLNTLRSARDYLKAKLAESEAKLAATVAEVARTKEQLGLAETEGKRLQTALAGEKQLLVGEKQQLAACVERDKELRKVSVEVLELYEKKTCSVSVLQNEPFTGLKRVQIENAVEDLRDKLDGQKTGS